MKTLNSLVFGSFFLLSTYCAAEDVLTVKITNFKSDKGEVLIQLYNEKHEKIGGRKGTIVNGVSTIEITDLAPGKYAIRFFHDENANNEFDMNWMKMPAEGYGFSNNAMGMFGPKDFSKWLFSFEATTTVEMKVKY